MALRSHICIHLGGKVIASHLILSSRDHRVNLYIYCLLSRRAKVLHYQPLAGNVDKGESPSSYGMIRLMISILKSHRGRLDLIRRL